MRGLVILIAAALITIAPAGASAARTRQNPPRHARSTDTRNGSLPGHAEATPRPAGF